MTNNGHRNTGLEGEIVKVPLGTLNSGLVGQETSIRLIGAALLSAIVGGGVYLLSRR